MHVLHYEVMERLYMKSLNSDKFSKFNHKKNTHDIIEDTIGDFGRWQLQVYLLMCVIAIPSNWVELGIELLAHKTEFRCKSEIGNNDAPVEIWKINSGGMHFNEEICTSVNKSAPACLWGYEYETSVIGSNIITEWDLVCERENLINVLQILVMFGSLVGSAIFGVFADMYGRRCCLLISTIARSIFGILSVFSKTFVSFAVARFILSVFDGGTTSTALIMCLEILGGSKRMTLSVLFPIPFGIGFPIMAGVTILLKDWRKTQLILFISSIFTIGCAWLAPESPRWLLAVNRTKEAVAILEKATEVNKGNKQMVQKIVDKSFYFKNDSTNDLYLWLSLFKTPKLRTRTILSCVNSLIMFTVYYGFFQYFGQFSSSPIIDVSVQGLSLIAGAVIAVMVVNKFSRRKTIAIISYCIGLSLYSIMLLPRTTSVLNVILSGIVYIGLGITTSIIEPMVCQMFPTMLRNSGLGIFAIFLCAGSMLAPLIIASGAVFEYMPLLVFSVLSVSQAVFVLLLPEISEDELPETIEDIECKTVFKSPKINVM